MRAPKLVWRKTTTTVAAEAGCQPNLVRLYADEGLLESRVLPNGVRLFKANAAHHVRKIKAERLSRRGRYVRPSAAF